MSLVAFAEKKRTVQEKVNSKFVSRMGAVKTTVSIFYERAGKLLKEGGVNAREGEKYFTPTNFFISGGCIPRLYHEDFDSKKDDVDVFLYNHAAPSADAFLMNIRTAGYEATSLGADNYNEFFGLSGADAHKQEEIDDNYPTGSECIYVRDTDGLVFNFVFWRNQRPQKVISEFDMHHITSYYEDGKLTVPAAAKKAILAREIRPVRTTVQQYRIDKWAKFGYVIG